MRQLRTEEGNQNSVGGVAEVRFLMYGTENMIQDQDTNANDSAQNAKAHLVEDELPRARHKKSRNSEYQEGLLGETGSKNDFCRTILSGTPVEDNQDELFEEDHESETVDEFVWLE